MELDLVIRGGTVATAARTFTSDVGVRDGRVAALGERLAGKREIDARGKLVLPGFIDTHVHSGHRASHRLITDVGRPDFYGQPFLEITVPRAGTRVGGDPHYLRPDDGEAGRANELHARFTVAEMLRNGTTTFM
ncbi:MAG: ethylammeline chlorohydrolase, partial [Burkholderiales bacterium]